MNETTLESIQSKIAFLERANTELSDQLYRQHREIEALTRRVAELASRLHAAVAEERLRSPDEERPPHY
jgi:uncharacterized coiled-coil protein SlyX